jgi:F-type H+-transporting ATPase subunit a
VTRDLAAVVPTNCTVDNSHLYSGCGFPAPGLNDFDFKPLFSIGSFNFTKPEMLALLSAVIVIGLFVAAFAKPKLIPGKLQSLGELGVLFVRDQILRPSLGKNGDKYLPLIVPMFFFILVMNLMELIPILQFPSFSRIGFVVPLAAIVYILYLYLGVKNQGGLGYVLNMWPRGVPWPVYIILIPVELLRFFIIQPFTLGIRLFANMFAGHLLLSMFMIATWYLAGLGIGALWAASSAIMVLFVFVLELLVDLLQAFIFTTLAATYIASSLEAQH